MAMILSGKTVRDYLEEELVKKILALRSLDEAGGGLNTVPELAIICVGENPESQIYVGQKKKFGDKLNIRTHLLIMPADIAEGLLISEIEKLNKDEKIGGIIVQLPIPKHLDKQKILDSIDFQKDVDGLGSIQAGMLYKNNPKAMVPATARGIMSLLDFYKIDLMGKNVVIVGRSDLVGKPMAIFCLNRDATVTVCHSKTKNLKDITKTADILIVACGVPKMITKDFVRAGQVVVDVGIHRTGEGLCGDVDFAEVAEIVSAISPVPGGVGPLTVVSLFQNLLDK